MNPLLTSPNKLKLGLFGTNGGATLTRVPEVWRPDWDRIVGVAKLADEAGLEASLGYARWKGYIPGMPEAGVGYVIDPFTWAAGLSQVTSYTTHIATVHGSVMHPVLAAKQCTTIDRISGGRFALNLVGGWNAIELDMFGTGLREHGARYDELEEWVQIVTRLWTEKEEFDMFGDYFEVKGGLSRPQPLQSPYPPIINAGVSPRGLDFSTTYADVCFTVPNVIGMDAKEKVDEYKDTARAKGREVSVWTYCAVVQRDSKAEAQEYLEYFTGPMAENELLDAWQAAALGAGEHNRIPAEAVLAMRQRFAAGSGGPILVGTASDIADQMEEMSEIGLDGILLTWPDFTDGVERLVKPGTGVLAELERRGLREPFKGIAA